MQYQNFGNRIRRSISGIFFFIVGAVLIFTTAAVLLQIIAIAAVVGGCIWCALKFVKFIKSKVMKKERQDQVVVEIVTEMQDTFTHSIIDVDYEEIK